MTSILFSTNNHVTDAVLSASPLPVTDIEWLKTDRAARQTRWTTLTDDIVIQGELPEPRRAQYFAIPGSNLTKEAYVKLELFSSNNSNTDILQTGFTQVGQMLPLGVWLDDIDPDSQVVETPLNNVFSMFFDQPITFQKFRLTIQHGYTQVYIPAPVNPDPEPTVITTTVSDGVYRQPSNGILSIEAENGVVRDAGLDSWVPVPDSNASGGVRMYKSGNEFYWNTSSGPRMTFTFTPSQTVSCDVWVRAFSTNGNSIYSVTNRGGKHRVFQNFINNGYQWHWVNNISLVEGNKDTVVIAARDRYISIDKIVVQPSGSTPPSGLGPPESEFGTITTTVTVNGQPPDEPAILTPSDSVDLRMLMIGHTMGLDENFSYGANMKFMTEPELHRTYNGSSLISRYQQVARSLRVPLNMMSDNDRLKMHRFETTLKGNSFLVSPYSCGPEWFTGDHIFLARFAAALDHSHRFSGVHKTELNLVEV